MAGNVYQLVIDAIYRGGDAFRKAQADMERLNKEGAAAPDKAKASLMGLSRTMVAFGGVAVAAGYAAKQLYGTLREGAMLQTTTQRFDKLADSIGTTADTMLGKLREATQGMISDIDLMASASQIMNLKLATSEDQVVRLATVAGKLNWDMSQVVLTFANMSTMRLDALGLSVEDVRKKADELKAAGMSAQEAFKEAVILAGEARLDVGGVSESERAFKQLEAAIANSKSELSLFLIELAEATGLIDAMSEAASDMALHRMAKAALEAGQITKDQFNEIELASWKSGAAMGHAALAAALLASEQQKAAQEAHNTAQANAILGVSIANVTEAELNFIMATQGVSVAIQNTSNAAMEAAAAADWALGAWASVIQKAQAIGGVTGSVQRGLDRGAAAAAINALPVMGKAIRETASAWGGYTAAVDEADQAHQRMGDTFSDFVDQLKARDEAMAKGGDAADFADMIIGPDGVVNINAANKALYEQAKAAGASAGELALLGVATGQLTEEQAKAALKAAILMERIKQLASSVVSGDISIGDAVGSLGGFADQMNAGALEGAQGGIEGLAQTAEEFAEGTYIADLNVDNIQANREIAETQEYLDDLTGTYYVNIVTTTTDGSTEGGGSSSDGGSTGTPYVPEGGGIPFVTDGAGWSSAGGATTVPGGDLGRSGDGRGGTTYSVVVNNYIDGKQAGRQSLDDITADKTRAALLSLGVIRQ